MKIQAIRNIALATTIAAMTTAGAYAANKQAQSVPAQAETEVVNNKKNSDNGNLLWRILGGLFVAGTGAIAYGTHKALNPSDKSKGE